MQDKFSSKKIFLTTSRSKRLKLKSSFKAASKSISTFSFIQFSRVFDTKQQQLKNQIKIARSSLINQMRIKVANLKYNLCDQIFKAVLNKLRQISYQKDSEYQLILIKYILQGCIQMFESNIKVCILQKDLDLVKILLPDVLKSFQYFLDEEIGQKFELNLIVSEKDCLKERNLLKQLDKNQQSEQGIGGVILCDITGNIVFKNTFDSRLNILKQNALPLMRNMLWGNQQGSEEEIKRNE